MKRIYLLMALLVSCGWLAKPCQAQTLNEQIQNIFLMSMILSAELVVTLNQHASLQTKTAANAWA